MRGSVISIVFGNLASKLIGVGREVFFAAWFGTGPVAAGFRVAQTAYLLPAQALIGDSLSAGLLPLYKKYQAEDPDKARVLVLVACVYGLVISLTASAAFYLGAEHVAAFVAPGAPAATQAISADLLRILGLSMPFFVLSGMLSYLETAYGRYGAIAWRPALLNIGSIAGAALAVWTGYNRWLAIGIVISHVVFAIVTMLELRKLDRLRPNRRPSGKIANAIFFTFFKNTVLLLGVPATAQLMLLVERMVSSHLSPRVIPSVDYARFISDTMVQLIAVPLGVLTMSTRGGENAEETRDHVAGAAYLSIGLTWPLALFIASYPHAVVTLLFARGAFNSESVEITTGILRWMGVGLLFAVTAYYLVKVLNSQLRNREALLAVGSGVSVSILVNVTLWRMLGSQTVGLALAGYNITMFLVAVIRLRLVGTLMEAVRPLMGLMALNVLVAIVANHVLGPILAAVIGGMVAALSWPIAYWRAPAFRTGLIEPLVAKITVLRKRSTP